MPVGTSQVTSMGIKICPAFDENYVLIPQKNCNTSIIKKKLSYTELISSASKLTNQEYDAIDLEN